MTWPSGRLRQCIAEFGWPARRIPGFSDRLTAAAVADRVIRVEGQQIVRDPLRVGGGAEDLLAI
jgi:hypothetical protein